VILISKNEEKDLDHNIKVDNNYVFIENVLHTAIIRCSFIKVLRKNYIHT
jgi:hypothetical protein